MSKFDYSKLPQPGELMHVDGRRIPEISRNLVGAAERDYYGRSGIRKFLVDLAPEEAEAMQAAGWPVGYSERRGVFYIVIGFFPDPKPGHRAPQVVIIDGIHDPKFLGKLTYHLFDSANIDYADMSFHAFYSKLGNIKIAIDNLYVHINVSNLEAMYPELMYPNADIYRADNEPAEV